MTEQNGTNRYQRAIDNTLSGLQADPFLAQRVIAQAEKGEKKMKYHIPRGIVIALIALLCMGTVAVAAGLYGGTTNWLGEVVPDERVAQSMPTAAPPMEIEQIDLNEDFLEHLAAEGTMLMVYEVTEDGEKLPETSMGIRRTAKSMDEFLALIAGAEYLPMPSIIPEKYEFVKGEVYYHCSADGQMELIDRKNLEGGLIADLYAPCEGDAVVSGYYLFFRDSPEDYHYLSICVSLSESQDLNEQRFGFLGGQSAQTVSVPGMNNALAITGDNDCSLYMLRTLESPVGIQFFWGPDIQEVWTCTEVDMTVSAPLLNIDTLIDMFANE